jgi:DNA-binding NtrC family response regulator
MHSLLVVDDEVGIRMLVARLGPEAGYAVSEASCAGEALDRMAECACAVVLCDVSMPDRNGLWLAAQLHRQFPSTALVMMSGLGEREMASGLEIGAMASLSKPFTRDGLKNVLKRALAWHLERAAGN